MASDGDDGLQVEGLRRNTTAEELGESDVTDVMIDDTPADHRVQDLETAVEGDGCRANGPCGDDYLRVADIKASDRLVVLAPNL